MKKISNLLVVLFLVLFLQASSYLPPQSVPPSVGLDPVKLEPHDRILIFAPHPDDEILGCAGIIQKAKAMNIPVRVLFLTFGDSNEWAFLFYRKQQPLFL